MPATHTAATVRQAFATVLDGAGLGLRQTQTASDLLDADPSRLSDGLYALRVPAERDAPGRLRHPGHARLEADVEVWVASRLRPTRGGDQLSDYDTAIGSRTSGIRKALRDDRDDDLEGIRVFYVDTIREEITEAPWLVDRHLFRAHYWETSSP